MSQNSAARFAFRSAALFHPFVVRSIGSHKPTGTNEPLEVICASRAVAVETYDRFVASRFATEMIQLVVRGVIVKVAERKATLETPKFPHLNSPDGPLGLLDKVAA